MDMDGQPRLFEPATEAIVMQAHYTWREGWTFHFQARRQGDVWATDPARFYGALTPEELLDVVAAEVTRALGL